VAAARLAEALRWAGVRLRCAAERLEVERLRVLVFERLPVEAERVRLVLLRRVLLVRRVPPVLLWVAIGGDPSSASYAGRFSGGFIPCSR
jgi:NADPH-dependent 2,4-dienoyl-CoA reductase/sulfur reductase-like enzyme